ncbi:acyl-coenzyme A diphosphatase FITM2 [Zootoca vivipara]|uniref:acyl-coenzyme A diphosphatase FITM2 n=1 Tax=Zootoca vivipara TaxID=8524 RepID=UPI00159040CD|nr:acyl-coenzyme A diphosphatase FITM2 [Zootoca vivipara]
MEYMDRSASFLRPYLVRDAARRTMPLGLLGLMLGGSVIKEWAPLPETYMSNKRNLINMYFVKVAWAWTLCLLLPFIGIATYHVTRSVAVVVRRLSALLVGTAIWYSCTGVFLYIENLTGSCYKSAAFDVPLEEHPNKIQCLKAGGFWNGFDISGHSFLLSYCALITIEEMAVLHIVNISKNSRLHSVVNGFFLGLSFLTMMWLWMFFTTAVYFHNFPQKLFGTLAGLLAWYGTYKYWYLTPLSPGLPPERTSWSSRKSNRSL